MPRFLFVGEQPSKTAFERGWTWESGRLAACTLFSALEACGIRPAECGFVNAFCDHPWKPDHKEIQARLGCIAAAAKAGVRVVAMGNKVAAVLAGRGVPYILIRHPAARGAGRAKSVYANHVRISLEVRHDLRPLPRRR